MVVVWVTVSLWGLSPELVDQIIEMTDMREATGR
jgi:hypothetical protein